MARLLFAQLSGNHKHLKYFSRMARIRIPICRWVSGALLTANSGSDPPLTYRSGKGSSESWNRFMRLLPIKPQRELQNSWIGGRGNMAKVSICNGVVRLSKVGVVEYIECFKTKGCIQLFL